MTTDRQVLQKGWALKVPTRATRFPDKVRNYLQEKFDVGNATGHKADPLQVSIDMRCARDELGRRLFAASERLQTQQIRSFFSRLAAAQRKKVQSPTDLIEDEVRDLESDTQAELYETELQELREGIIAEVAEKHPICYERFNLCEQSQKNMLKKFNIDKLVRTCEHFELDIAKSSLEVAAAICNCFSQSAYNLNFNKELVNGVDPPLSSSALLGAISPVKRNWVNGYALFLVWPVVASENNTFIWHFFFLSIEAKLSQTRKRSMAWNDVTALYPDFFK